MNTFLINRQLEENAREQRNNDAYWNNLQIEKLNEEIELLKEQNSILKKANKASFIKGILIALIPSLIILGLTIYFTHKGLL